jgi:hypothetical protein
MPASTCWPVPAAPLLMNVHWSRIFSMTLRSCTASPVRVWSIEPLLAWLPTDMPG